jgi:ATP-dependent DNA helicase RecG
MPEHQEIEWKESWRDDYLKWLCGYANAHGGTLFIGKDDDGNVVGIRGSKKLLEDLPNKITNAMGIIADVNLHTENGKEFIEIVVDKYPFLISYHGQYYYRSGSVLREIVGKELERALLKSQGKTWDGVSLPKLSVADLKPEAIALFKQKALARGRLIAEEATVSNDVLMENLHLVDEDGSLIRAAMLAFYRDPERWVTGAYIKIGFFGDSDSDLQYQDEIHGPLIEQIDRTIDLVYTKYMKARITYEGIQRVEVFMFPREAFREILLHAVVPKDYSSCNPIQISIYEDHMYIWNDGQMPANLRTTESLFAKHSSKPFNPKLAHVLFISGMIEAWGRGFDKIKTACDALYHTPIPDYEMSGDGIMVHCHANEKYLQLAMENRLGVDETILSRFRDAERMDVIRIMELCDTSKRFTSAEVQAILGKPKPTVARLLKKICDTGLLKMVGSGRATKYQKSSQNHETI